MFKNLGFKKLVISLLVVTALILGASVYLAGNSGAQAATTAVYGSTFRVTRTNTFVGSSPNANRLTTINTTGAIFRRTSAAPQQMGGWTWVEGRLSGTNAQLGGLLPTTVINGVPRTRTVWIATSQLERIRNGGRTTIECPVTDPSNYGFTSVRHTFNGANVGRIETNRNRRIQFEFRPTGDLSRRDPNRDRYTWRLGTIFNGPSDWNGRTVWIATSQFPFDSPCR